MSLNEQVQPLTRPRKPSTAEGRAVAETLAAAFFDDLVLRWAWHNPERRRQILPDFFELMVTGSLAHDEAYMTHDLAGQRCGCRQSRCSLQTKKPQALPPRSSVTPRVRPRRSAAVRPLDEYQPHQPPHYYLPIVGTRPEHQGRGIGSALLAPVLEQCDQEALCAYLEATSERNQNLYVRHGFQVIDEIPIPGGPTLWPMWREPTRPRN